MEHSGCPIKMFLILKDWLIVKNLQFLSNQADIQGLAPNHELIILTKFCEDGVKFVDFFYEKQIFHVWNFFIGHPLHT